MRLGPVLVVVALLLSGCVASPPRPSATAIVEGGADASPEPTGLVTVTECPASPGGVHRTDISGAAVLLLPFRPARILLCRYGGSNSGHSQRLVQSRVVTANADVSALAASIDAQSGHHLQTASCPADFGTITTLFAQDARSSRWLVLRISRTGCRTISNGSILNATESDRLERRLTIAIGSPGR